MDIANASANAFLQARELLQSLEKDINQTIADTSSQLKKTFPSIDSNLQGDLNEFIDLLDSFQQTLHAEFLENDQALAERINKIQLYQQTAYHSRNIDF